MLLGAFGERANDLLAAGTGHSEPDIERTGPLALAGAEGATQGHWQCWIRGHLTNREELCERFGLGGDVEPAVVVATAHAQLGEQACESLRGTFVVAALDRERRLAFVARDQLGGRPLVSARVGDGVIFAEHERALLDVLPSSPGPDRLALLQWIDGGTTPSGRTLYDGIGTLAPGHRLALSPGAVRVERYWRPRYEEPLAGSRAEIAEGLLAAAFAAVGRATTDTQLIALRLSGGLDSACVAAGLAAMGPAPPAPVAVGGVFPDHPLVDERPLIEATARHTGLPLELVPFDRRASIMAPALAHLARWRVPPASLNLFTRRPLSERARELGADAMIDGEGGDELFGLAPYLIADMLRGGRVARAWSLSARIPGLGEHPERRVRLRALRLFGVRALIPAPALRVRRRLRRDRDAGSLLRPADAREVGLAVHEDIPRREELAGPIWWRALVDELVNGGEPFGASSHFRREEADERLEWRQPFLYDLELLRFALTIPPELRFDPVRDRALLRDALATRIPEAVRTRYDKSDLTAVLRDALAAEGELISRQLRAADAPLRAYLRAAALDELIARPPQTLGPEQLRQLWRAALADAWLSADERPDSLEELSHHLARPARG